MQIKVACVDRDVKGTCVKLPKSYSVSLRRENKLIESYTVVRKNTSNSSHGQQLWVSPLPAAAAAATTIVSGAPVTTIQQPQPDC